MNKLVFLLLSALVLTGCQMDQTRLTGTARPEPLVCTVWHPISYASRHDSPETVGEIRRNNAKRQAYCH